MPPKQTDRRRSSRPPAGAAPGAARLHEAALAHLARFAATAVGLTRVLDRRIDRWARAAAAEEADGEAVAQKAAAARQAAREVVAKLVASGVIDDAAFATARARRLNRAGRSRRAVTAHLLARGVDRDLAGEALPDDPEAELAAALAFARRRRVGPFRTGEADADIRRREAGMLARAGFGQEIASRALRMDPEEAEAAVLRLRQS